MNTANNELIFSNRKIIGENILMLIKDGGYTKSSFSKLVDISRPTLNSLIAGQIDNVTTLRTHIEKILNNQGINNINDLINYSPKDQISKIPDVMFSNNSPENHVLKSQAKEMFAILDDIAHLCELYYR